MSKKLLYINLEAGGGIASGETLLAIATSLGRLDYQKLHEDFVSKRSSLKPVTALTPALAALEDPDQGWEVVWISQRPELARFGVINYLRSSGLAERSNAGPFEGYLERARKLILRAPKEPEDPAEFTRLKLQEAWDAGAKSIALIDNRAPVREAVPAGVRAFPTVEAASKALLGPAFAYAMGF
jgi:hypothetical protein